MAFLFIAVILGLLHQVPEGRHPGLSTDEEEKIDPYIYIYDEFTKCKVEEFGL